MKLVELSGVTRSFASGRRARVLAVDNVSFSINRGESVGLVGESGSGKSTLSRLICGLTPAEDGEIRLNGKPITAPSRAVQMVFQSADEALNPAFTIARNIAVGLGLSNAGALPEVRSVAAKVGLPPELLPRLPHQLSGGQQARAGIARALIAQPELLLLDEPTAALDVSVQALVLRLIDRLRTETGCATLLVSHDLDVVRLMCTRVLVMYRGRIVEAGPVNQIIEAPRHPYTRLLVSATPGRNQGDRMTLPSTAPHADTEACHFRDRCPMATDICAQSRPKLDDMAPGHAVACHHSSSAAPQISGSGAC
ncbi:ABC transporter ATP-binding protein [Sinirhodobacter sp. WL0062]|uniref:ABC transporter ATP-binding protein n=1 Tax=Rhodobacter flavimaris TaxID=2907145 RepID=A0ABS8YZJ8_9RHOB|nr:ABC transporter ATP-binding protein [Sinirhodobacter sp. WL0062]MCE5973100.1 ABC transporter ATP-binding protein [Sinirhodobacter sp. WL0062]